MLKLGQEAKPLEAQKWQIYLGIRLCRLSGEKLTLCCDILAGLWAPRANPKLNPAFWRQSLPQDWLKLGQEGEHLEAQTWQI